MYVYLLKCKHKCIENTHFQNEYCELFPLYSYRHNPLLSFWLNILISSEKLGFLLVGYKWLVTNKSGLGEVDRPRGKAMQRKKGDHLTNILTCIWENITVSTPVFLSLNFSFLFQTLKLESLKHYFLVQTPGL